MRVLCVSIPHFPLMCELGRKTVPTKHPAIVTYTSGSPKLVLDYSPELKGLQPDMPLQRALAQHRQAGLLQADVPYYRSAFNAVLDALENISPLVEGAGIGCAYISVDGLQLIYPDDAALTDAVCRAVPETFTLQIGLAGNKFLACLPPAALLAGGWHLPATASTFSVTFPAMSCRFRHGGGKSCFISRSARWGYPRGRQMSLLTEFKTREHLMKDIKQLELNLGNPQIYRVKEVEPWSRIPERRYALAPTER